MSVATSPRQLIEEGARALGVPLSGPQLDRLERHMALLLRWNQRINLTAVTDLLEVAERHVVDSLAAAALVPAGSLLDAGAGGGFPGGPLRVARDDLQVWMVDSVHKKVAFLKALQAELGLPGLRASSVRLAGHPEKEGLPRFRSAIARAFMAPADWLALAERYLEPGGSVFCLLGAKDEAPERLGSLVRAREMEHRLPLSGAARKIVEYRQDVPRGTVV